MTKSEKLLRQMARSGGMTVDEITNFLGYNGGSNLYGNRYQVGLLERFCERDDCGRYHVVRKISSPFHPKRRMF